MGLEDPTDLLDDIRQALEQTKWNRTQAARLLGISRRQLFEKVRLYELHE